jgi:hypothetical protein
MEKLTLILFLSWLLVLVVRFLIISVSSPYILVVRFIFSRKSVNERVLSSDASKNSFAFTGSKANSDGLTGTDVVGMEAPTVVGTDAAAVEAIGMKTAVELGTDAACV